jgi:hypothetical protein
MEFGCVNQDIEHSADQDAKPASKVRRISATPREDGTHFLTVLRAKSRGKNEEEKAVEPHGEDTISTVAILSTSHGEALYLVFFSTKSNAWP